MMTNDEIKNWESLEKHYALLGGKYTDASSQLACLVLAAYCMDQASGDRGGPSDEMVGLAEKILGLNAPELSVTHLSINNAEEPFRSLRDERDAALAELASMRCARNEVQAIAVDHRAEIDSLKADLAQAQKLLTLCRFGQA